jgi:hypothetical protein
MKIFPEISTSTGLTDAELRASAVAISASSLPLPTGAATSALQTTGNTSLAALAAIISAGKLLVDIGSSTVSISGTVPVSQSGTWNITNISGTISLPTGAATESTLSALNTKIPTLTLASTRLLVDGSGVTQPISGTLAATQSGTWSVRTQDGSGNALTSHLAGSSRGVDVSIIDGSGNQITSFGGGTQYTEGDTDSTITGTALMWEDGSDTLRVASAAKPLPVNVVSGSTSGTEYTEGDTDASITGTAILMEGAANTLLPVPGTVSDGLLVNLGSNNDVTASQTGTWNIGTVSTITNVVHIDDNSSTISIDDAGGSITIDGTVAATQSGTWNVGTLSTITNVVHVDDNSSTLSIDDGGGSITIDGSVSVSGAVDTELTTADLDTGAGTDTRAVVGLVLAESGGGLLVGSAHPMPVHDNGTTISIDDAGGSITIDGTVTITDGSGAISIDDNGGSITVDGSVTVTQATGTNLHAVIDSGVITTVTNVVHVDDNSSSLTVDNGGTFATQVTSLIPGTSSTSLGKAEDSVFTDGDTGVLTLGVRQDAPISDTSTSGDYSAVKTDPQGRLWVNSDVMSNIMSQNNEYLLSVITELRVMNSILREGLNIKDQLESLRADESRTVNNLIAIV